MSSNSLDLIELPDAIILKEIISRLEDSENYFVISFIQ